MDKIITGGLLDTDIGIILSSERHPKMKYRATLTTPYGDISLAFLQNVEWVRNYNNNKTDDIRVTFTIGGGLYRDAVMNCKDRLELTLERLRGDEVIYSTRYKFIILDSNERAQKDMLTYMSTKDLEALNPIQVQGQCIDMDVYSLEDVQVEGVYKNTDLSAVITTEIMTSINNVTYGTGFLNLNLNMTEVDNNNKYRHVIIPTGIKLLDLPTYLQVQDSYGLYNAGLGTYVQYFNKKKYIFIYPLFDVKQFGNTDKKLMIFHSNNRRVGTGGITWMVDGEITKILPQYDVKLSENDGKNMTESGNTISYATPDTIYSPTGKVQDDKLSDELKNKVVTQQASENADGTNKSTWLGTINNAYKYRGQFIQNQMRIITLNWHDCDIDILYPGMPCVYLYETPKDGIIKLYGVVQAAVQMWTPDTKIARGQVIIAVMDDATFMNNDSYDTGLKS